MATFITRIELLDTGSDSISHYETLYEAMKDAGFSKFIKSRDSTKYHLPTTEYSLRGELKIKDILESAKKCAGKTGLKFRILVTKSEEITQCNLEESKN